eukprot:scaffold42462_cov58-Phaeocystis_antarctica.AAC.6
MAATLTAPQPGWRRSRLRPRRLPPPFRRRPSPHLPTPPSRHVQQVLDQEDSERAQDGTKPVPEWPPAGAGRRAGGPPRSVQAGRRCHQWREPAPGGQAAGHAQPFLRLGHRCGAVQHGYAGHLPRAAQPVLGIRGEALRRQAKRRDAVQRHLRLPRCTQRPRRRRRPAGRALGHRRLDRGPLGRGRRYVGGARRGPRAGCAGRVRAGGRGLAQARSDQDDWRAPHLAPRDGDSGWGRRVHGVGAPQH